MESPSPGSSRPKGTSAKEEAVNGLVGNPIRILVAGPVGLEKRTLIDGLLNRYTEPGAEQFGKATYTASELDFGDGHQTVLINSPDMLPAGKRSADLLEAADQSDVIVWVTPENSHQRPAERATLDAIRKQSFARTKRKPQPILGVMLLSNAVTGMDTGSSPLTAEMTIAIAEDLGFEPDQFLAASVSAGNYANIENLRQKLTELMPEAARIQKLRQLDSTDTGLKWSRLLSQVVNAGRSWRVRPEKYK